METIRGKLARKNRNRDLVDEGCVCVCVRMCRVCQSTLTFRNSFLQVLPLSFHLQRQLHRCSGTEDFQRQATMNLQGNNRLV